MSAETADRLDGSLNERFSRILGPVHVKTASPVPGSGEPIVIDDPLKSPVMVVEARSTFTISSTVKSPSIIVENMRFLVLRV
jgi:hypothetical protein